MKSFFFLLFLLLFLSAYGAAELPSGPDFTITPIDGPVLRSRAAHEAAWYEESKVKERLMAMKSSYPEGKAWTNASLSEQPTPRMLLIQG